MKKYISILLAAVLVLACLSACGTSDKPADADNSEKLSVVTTIFPQYDFTRQIVGDKADVTMLLKPGAESHSYEPTPQDIKLIYSSTFIRLFQRFSVSLSSLISNACKIKYYEYTATRIYPSGGYLSSFRKGSRAL